MSRKDYRRYGHEWADDDRYLDELGVTPAQPVKVAPAIYLGCRFGRHDDADVLIVDPLVNSGNFYKGSRFGFNWPKGPADWATLRTTTSGGPWRQFVVHAPHQRNGSEWTHKYRWKVVPPSPAYNEPAARAMLLNYCNCAMDEVTTTLSDITMTALWAEVAGMFEFAERALPHGMPKCQVCTTPCRALTAFRARRKCRFSQGDWNVIATALDTTDLLLLAMGIMGFLYRYRKRTLAVRRQRRRSTPTSPASPAATSVSFAGGAAGYAADSVITPSPLPVALAVPMQSPVPHLPIFSLLPVPPLAPPPVSPLVPPVSQRRKPGNSSFKQALAGLRELSQPLAKEAEGLRLHLSRTNSTGYRGVFKSRGRFKVSRTHAGQTHSLGIFNTAVEGAVAYAADTAEAAPAVTPTPTTEADAADAADAAEAAPAVTPTPTSAAEEATEAPLPSGARPAPCRVEGPVLERLSLLRRLFDEGLISEDELKARRSEIIQEI